MTGAADLIRLANECWISRALHTAVLLGVADALEGTSTPVEDLADRLRCDCHMMQTVLKVLAHRGVFHLADGRVSHTEASLLLRSGTDAGLADIIEWMGSAEVWNSLGKLPEAIAQGHSGFESAYNEKLFRYLTKNPDRSGLFDRHMEGYTKREIERVLAVLDLQSFKTIADIGAGSGMLASEIARRYPAARIFVFDLPGCSFSAIDEPTSIERIHGDFFVDGLPAADLMILSNVLHDWPDGDAMRILHACRRAAHEHSCLCIVEGLPESLEEKVDMVDFGMAVMTGGRQRPLEKWAAMLLEIGYEISDVRRCSEYVSVILAHPLGRD